MRRSLGGALRFVSYKGSKVGEFRALQNAGTIFMPSEIPPGFEVRRPCGAFWQAHESFERPKFHLTASVI